MCTGPPLLAERDARVQVQGCGRADGPGDGSEASTPGARGLREKRGFMGIGVLTQTVPGHRAECSIVRDSVCWWLLSHW